MSIGEFVNKLFEKCPLYNHQVTIWASDREPKYQIDSFRLQDSFRLMGNTIEELLEQLERIKK